MLTRLTDERSTAVVTLSPAWLRLYLPNVPPGPERETGPLGIAGERGARQRKGP
jgi:hypothetical protein